ncbi:cytochrome P450 2D6-like [Branchiostoma lanceolatum]|uniref:cytochrome P450 2D6-like n=1 Tax=Branchiostoma lanceolatum TaxID=7740 RepID=UPI0034515516
MAAGVSFLAIVEFSRLNLQTFLVFCLAFLLACLLKRPRNLPPYPAGRVPVLGHLLALGRAPHLRLTEWRRQYGDVVTIRIGMQDVVVLNGYAAVRDAMVDRSELFASRPAVYIPDLLSGFGKEIVGARWGQEFKQRKKFATTVMKNLGMKVGKGSIEEKIQEEARCLCDKFAAYKGAPFDAERDLQVTIANVICSMAFGHRFEYDDARFRELSEAFVSTLMNLASLSGQLISVFPFLRFVPGVNKAVSDSIRGAEKIQTFLWDEISRHRQDLDRENPRDFLDFGLIEVEQQARLGGLTEENVMYISQTLFVAGIDTTSTTLRWSLLYMALHPDIQEKVQQELDDVVGDAVPTLSHRARLPYTEATVMEVQRVRTTVPLGIPHATTQQVKVGRYDVPAGTQVLANLHSLHTDPDYWPDPDRFDPGRFLDAEGNVISKPHSFMPFSGGRRVCLGEQLAKMNLILVFSSLLQNFTFKLPEGAPAESTDGILRISLAPHPHKLCAIPR